jgi:hypothetical protein
MSGDEAHAPFGDDYPETRGRKALKAERKRVDDEVKRLRKLQKGASRHDRPTVVHGEQLAAVTVERVRRGKGRSEVMVARGSAILARAAADRRCDDLRDQFELLVVDDGVPDFPLVRLERSARCRSTDDTPKLLADINGGDAPAPNHVVPLGGIVLKAYGSATPSQGGREFASVPVPAGPGPRVAVIDTGVSLEQRTDGYLQNLLRPDNLDPLDVLPFPYADGDLDAAAGHGSAVVGIVQQVAPGARLRVHKVTDPFGVGTDWQIAQAIQRAAADGATIINVSMGTATVDGEPPAAMAAALAMLPDGVLVVAAAGNGGDDEKVWPAAFAETMPARVVAVGALDPDGSGSKWSSRGAWVTCSAIGRGVPSTYVIGQEDLAQTGGKRADTFGANSWATCLGTSFAAPQIAGGVARLCHEHPDLTPRAALDRLLDGAPRDDGFGARVRLLPGT